MNSAPNAAAAGELVAALTAAFAIGSTDAFTALLTEDVRWGGERHDGDECTTREQAGRYYADMLAAGATLHLTEVHPTPLTTAADVITLRVQRRSPDPNNPPQEMTVQLTLRGALIADIRVLDTPPTIEVLYLEGCPHYEAFLPHLHELLDSHGISTPITLIRIDNDDDAQAHRFLGSPTMRVNGHDIDPATAQREHRTDHPDHAYGMQCRLYTTAHGTSGTPRDEWITAALADNPTAGR